EKQGVSLAGVSGLRQGVGAEPRHVPEPSGRGPGRVSASEKLFLRRGGTSHWEAVCGDAPVSCAAPNRAASLKSLQRAQRVIVRHAERGSWGLLKRQSPRAGAYPLPGRVLAFPVNRIIYGLCAICARFHRGSLSRAGKRWSHQRTQGKCSSQRSPKMGKV